MPVIENTAREYELTERLRKAIQDYPRANAVLVGKLLKIVFSSQILWLRGS